MIQFDNKIGQNIKTDCRNTRHNSKAYIMVIKHIHEYNIRLNIVLIYCMKKLVACLAGHMYILTFGWAAKTLGVRKKVSLTKVCLLTFFYILFLLLKDQHLAISMKFICLHRGSLAKRNQQNLQTISDVERSLLHCLVIYF